jgi:two-component system NarL family sensor kinase
MPLLYLTMADFIWNIGISYLVLFLVLSICLHIYTKEKSFKYYAYYNVTILFYLLTKKEPIYYYLLDVFQSVFNPSDANLFFNHLNWYVQVVFYNFYFIFSIYFLDLDRLFNVLSIKIIKILSFLWAFFSIIFLVSFKLKTFHIFFNFFQFLYLPTVLILFLYLVPKAIKHSGKHKYFFLTGLFFYVFFALVSFYMSVYMKLGGVKIFLIGIIIENFCFAFGLAYKIKLVNEENQKNKVAVFLEKQNQELSKIEALIDGEEKERRRIAQELHDGLNGDLSAIKYRLSRLEESNLSTVDSENLTKIIDMIDESCAQVRSISHNLMPSSILDYGLIETVKEYCIKINTSATFKIDLQFFGNYITLSKKSETVIYRIIQELVTNILKHSKATEAIIQFNYREDELFITVEDNGIGFDKNTISQGIGHKNIKTRIEFLNAQLDFDSSPSGTSYTISIDLNQVK